MPTLDVTRLQRDLTKMVRTLHDDLRERCDNVSEVGLVLQGEYEQAREAQRTSESLTAWRESYLNQVAVAWVLATVFLRYLEDNELLEEVWLAGVGTRRNQAQERYSAYFRAHPEQNDRDYFYHVFEETARLPGCADIFGQDKNALWKVGVSGDGAKKLREFWQEIDPATGALTRELSGADTRFLGDLYQNLSEEARSRYALLQTPDFVESFILDRTLEPAIREFGLEEVRLLDPTCGSGHFLLGAFDRLLGHWKKKSIDNPRVLARRALEAVHGIDINPFAVAIARFRLVLAFLQACGFTRLKDMPDIHPRVATGDSLLFAREFDRQGARRLIEWLPEPFAVGDYAEAVEILKTRYHAVVGNPPYITDKDKRHNEVVRGAYYSCHRQYSLGVPFTERFFDLAIAGSRAGYVGLITTNSFMKREFGKKLIENVLPRHDLTHVLDTSGAYIPGHGTPTVILFGRNRPPTSGVVRAILGTRGEPSTPDDPSKGLVWVSVINLIDAEPGTQNTYVSVAQVERKIFAKHPWSVGGGGVVELKDRIEKAATSRLREVISEVGFGAVTRDDEVYSLGRRAMERSQIPLHNRYALVGGDEVRDYEITNDGNTLFPYDTDLHAVVEPTVENQLWPWKRQLSERVAYGYTQICRGLKWFEYSMLFKNRLRSPLSIAFAEIATHNHFVLDRGGRVFKQTAPIIKLDESASEDDHLVLLGLLNSSTACFWFRQVCTGKHMGDGGDAHADPVHQRFVHNASRVEEFPLAQEASRILAMVRTLDELARVRANHDPSLGVPSEASLAHAEQSLQEIQATMVTVQEEIDWLCYELYGLLEKAPLHTSPEPLLLGQRAFEIALARSGEETTWFSRHRSQPITELPKHWSDDYCSLVEARLELIETNPEIQLLEKPEHKRRWQSEPWDVRVNEALKTWLIDRIEAKVKTSDQMLSCTRLADQLAGDAEFLSVLALYKKRDDFHLVSQVTELVLPEGIPYLSACRYSDSGLRIRAEWEKTWELQRRQDAGESIDIAVPPKYGNKDFRKSEYWRLRGKLDVPKERFILYPGAEREADPSPMLGWAGWNHLQRAAALATTFLARKEEDGWGLERLQPLLAGLAELLPWLRQWHNTVDPSTGERLGDFYESFLLEEARALGLTLEKLAHCPCPYVGGGRRNLHVSK